MALTAAAILVVAIGIGYTQKVNRDRQRGEELTLQNDLAAMRKALADYHAKHHRNPASLDDLVRDGELRRIPVDPFTRSNTTWKTTVEESVSVDDFQPGAAKAPPSIVDVHSGASGRDSAGRAFADY